MNITIIFVIILIILTVLFTMNNEGFYIEPNTVEGGAMPESGMILTSNGYYVPYNQPLELAGPGNPAETGY